MEKNSTNHILSEIDKYLGIGVALFGIKDLSVVHNNDLFLDWFPEADSTTSLEEIFSDLDSEKLLKRILKGKVYKREKEIKRGNRNRILKIEFTKISEELGLIKVQDITNEKELEFMMDSYAKIAEKNKRELEGANARIQAQNNRMLKELEIARQVQKGMLPFDFNPENENVEFAALLKPAMEVAGDFFDIFYVDSENLCICLGDVSDKGAGAALFMAATKTLINSHAINSKSTASIVRRINNELVKNNDKCMFTTLFIGIFDINKGNLLYSNCGHCIPYLIDENKSMSELKELSGPAIGIVPNFSFTEQEIQLKPNQTLFVYSDGVTESRNVEDELFTDLRLKNLIKSKTTVGNPEAIIHYAFDAVEDFEKGTEQSDDITILAFKFAPK